MKKGIKLTNDNIQLVMCRINEYLSKNECYESYADWGKYPKQLNRLGILSKVDNKNIERSNTSYILKSKYQIRIEPNYGIIVNCDKASAFSILIGDRVTVNANKLQIKSNNVFLKKYSTTFFKPCSDIETAKVVIAFDEEMDAQYWKDCDDEYYAEINDKSFNEMLNETENN